jgi:transposase
MIAAVRSELSVNDPVLYVAFELAKKEWKLAMTSGFGVPPWLRTVPAGDLEAVQRALRAGGARFQVPASARIVSCYEAGRDGFWVHRALEARGVANRVVDSASIEVNRRARRTKTDRLDALKLVTMLVRVCQGESRVWAEVRVPPVAVEAARHVSRERAALRKEQTRLRNQIGSWLATWGCRVSARMRRQAEWWTQARDWANTALPAAVQVRIARAETRLALVTEQVAAIEAAQAQQTRDSAATSARHRLVQLRGVGTTSAAV